MELDEEDNRSASNDHSMTTRGRNRRSHTQVPVETRARANQPPPQVPSDKPPQQAPSYLPPPQVASDLQTDNSKTPNCLSFHVLADNLSNLKTVICIFS